jgi:hypothetical protein
LDDGELGALWIRDHREAPDADLAHRPAPTPTAQLGLPSGGVGVLDPEIRKPAPRDAAFVVGLGTDASVATTGVGDRT